MFPPTSRYAGVPTTTLQVSEEKAIAYLRRRFVPQPGRFALLQEHLVVAGDRLDNVTARYLSDPEQFWRIADANGAMKPWELTATVGRRLRVTLPEGIPEMPHA